MGNKPITDAVRKWSESTAPDMNEDQMIAASEPDAYDIVKMALTTAVELGISEDDIKTTLADFVIDRCPYCQKMTLIYHDDDEPEDVVCVDPMCNHIPARCVDCNLWCHEDDISIDVESGEKLCVLCRKAAEDERETQESLNADLAGNAHRSSIQQ